MECWQIFIEKMTFNNNTRSKRHSSYYGFVESRVATRSQIVIRGCRLWAACYTKMVPKRCLFENPENRKGHPKTTFYFRHCDLLKTVPGAVWKNMNNQWKFIEK